MKKEKIEKTNAMRLLDRAGIPYRVHTYPHGDGPSLGVDVAAPLQIDPAMVFKTLLCVSLKKQYYVFVVPSNAELDLKKCAKAVKAKSVELIPVKEINQVSGYVRGGCSPLGMKKTYVTVFDITCLRFDTIVFSAGKIGYQIETNPHAVIKLLGASTAAIQKE